MEEKLGKTIIDGKLVDLDSVPMEEIDNMLASLKKKEQELRGKIDDELEKMKEDNLDGERE